MLFLWIMLAAGLDGEFQTSWERGNQDRVGVRASRRNLHRKARPRFPTFEPRRADYPFPSKAEDQQRPRASNPPLVCLATAVEKDGGVQMRLSASILHPYKITSPVPHTVEVPAKEGKGKRYETRWEWKTETAYICLAKKTVFAVDGKEVKVSRKNGQKVDPRDLPKLLRKETPVLLFTKGKIDSKYLRLVHDDALIVVGPVHKVFPREPEEE